MNRLRWPFVTLLPPSVFAIPLKWGIHCLIELLAYISHMEVGKVGPSLHLPGPERPISLCMSVKAWIIEPIADEISARAINQAEYRVCRGPLQTRNGAEYRIEAVYTRHVAM